MKDPDRLIEIGRLARLRAFQTRVRIEGVDRGPPPNSCHTVDYGIGIQALCTRDEGLHTSGWLKNPDYERCLHLSISFFDPETGLPAPHRHAESQLIAKGCFREHINFAWIEPPTSPHGKTREVFHYRVFYLPGWLLPILPRGEVYNRENTPAGWKSWSDRIHAEAQEAQKP